MNGLDKLTWDECINWFDSATEADVNAIDDLGDSPGACWVGACYILDTLGLPYIVDGHRPPIYSREITAHDLLGMKGWVHVHADCDEEFHYFSLFIVDESKAYLVHVYDELKKKVIDLKDWVELLEKRKWRELFDIPRTHKHVKDTTASISLSMY